MICCFSLSKANIPSCCVKHAAAPWQSRRRSSPAALGLIWWRLLLLVINTCPGMQWRAPAMHKKHDEQQAEGREASHGSKRPSLIARNGLPVTSDSERSWSDSACCHGMQLGGGASTVLRANHPWLLSASYAVPCQACSSLGSRLVAPIRRQQTCFVFIW